MTDLKDGNSSFRDSELTATDARLAAQHTGLPLCLSYLGFNRAPLSLPEFNAEKKDCASSQLVYPRDECFPRDTFGGLYSPPLRAVILRTMMPPNAGSRRAESAR